MACEGRGVGFGPPRGGGRFGLLRSHMFMPISAMYEGLAMGTSIGQVDSATIEGLAITGRASTRLRQGDGGLDGKRTANTNLVVDCNQQDQTYDRIALSGLPLRLVQSGF